MRGPIPTPRSHAMPEQALHEGSVSARPSGLNRGSQAATQDGQEAERDVGRANNHRPSVSPPAAAPVPAPDVRPAHLAGRRRGPRLLSVVGAFLAILALVAAGRRLVDALNTISTDDAYVNGHVTFVAPRVAGQV